MNCFLVLGRCSADDIPVGFFPSREEAMRHAEGMTGDDVLAVAKHLGMSVSSPDYVSVVEFNPNGAPQRIVGQREFD
jgi:hypothetical protein